MVSATEIQPATVHPHSAVLVIYSMVGSLDRTGTTASTQGSTAEIRFTIEEEAAASTVKDLIKDEVDSIIQGITEVNDRHRLTASTFWDNFGKFR